ncbi:MAG: YdeI/OmpD-associated family protein [Verrucomicrobiota bacterium]
MQISEVISPATRADWRAWLFAHHESSTEIWVERFHLRSGKPSITYDELVEECLCFGWIDGIMKKWSPESSVQRTTPRRAKSFLSELNRQRIWKLREANLMTAAGEAAVEGRVGEPDDPFEIPDWIERELRRDKEVRSRFEALPRLYRRLRVGYITEADRPNRRPEAENRLANLIRKTKAGKRYGTEPLRGILYEK